MTKVDFQVLCLQVRGSRKISEVQVRVCHYWYRLFSFTQSSSQVCVGGYCVSKLCKGYTCSFGVKLPCANPTSLRADTQWIIILETFELVTFSFSQFHAQHNWLLTHALHIFNQYMRLLCCFWSLMWLRKIENCFLEGFVWSHQSITGQEPITNISETICSEMLVFGK